MVVDERQQFLDACARGDWSAILTLLESAPAGLRTDDPAIVQGLLEASIQSHEHCKRKLIEYEARLEAVLDTMRQHCHVLDQLERENAQLRATAAVAPSVPDHYD